MKDLKLVLLMLVLGVFIVGSQVLADNASCYKPPTPDCICNCGDTVVLPGLWEVNVTGLKRCGEITIIGGASAILEDQRKDKVFFLLNKVKLMKQVEICE